MFIKHISSLHYISPDIQLLDTLLSNGLNWVQLRMKEVDKERLKKEASMAVALCKQYGATCIINDHAEIAKEVGAHGVHLGLSDMKVRDARKMLGEQAIIGGTCNTPEDILYQYEQGTDYVGLGPFRFTTTKKNLSPIIGIEGYEKCMEFCDKNNIHIPVIAIGGILPNDLTDLLATGIHGVAVSSVIRNQPNPTVVLSELKEILKTTSV